MSDFRRFFVPGATVFLTVICYGRRKNFAMAIGRRLLHDSIVRVRDEHPFQLIATVLLTDHWHLLMGLPPGDADYSLRIQQVKQTFTAEWLERGLPEAKVTEAQRRKGMRGIWQPRFWEHTVRDEEDLERCADYIHWNPRKHELVRSVRDWQFSSFHRFVEMGHYDIDWGGTAPECMKFDRDWGEPSS